MSGILCSYFIAGRRDCGRARQPAAHRALRPVAAALAVAAAEAAVVPAAAAAQPAPEANPWRRVRGAAAVLRPVMPPAATSATSLPKFKTSQISSKANQVDRRTLEGMRLKLPACRLRGCSRHVCSDRMLCVLTGLSWTASPASCWHRTQSGAAKARIPQRSLQGPEPQFWNLASFRPAFGPE